MKFSRIIHAVRTYHNLSTHSMARKMGFSQAYISKMEQSEADSNPSMKFLDKFCNEFRISPNFLFNLYHSADISDEELQEKIKLYYHYKIKTD